ncbi:MAG: 7-carboxy-7-deazaguanine synthase QueE [Bacteroidetes bacterium]|nr:7-carboxy-7-deazaguanine synthase QueE [Bacteroidota bacterium]
MEHYYTIQGEGYNTGKACYFIRLGGCDVGCVWCDVKESWDGTKYPLMSAIDLLKLVKKTNAERVVITGGEPLMYDLKELTKLFRKNSIELFLETSGAYSLTGSWDWICVSPKKFKKPLDEVLSKADELKVIVYNKSDFEWAEKHRLKVKSSCQLFLQPEYSVFKKVMPAIIDYVKQHPQWTISLQTHKVLDIP